MPDGSFLLAERGDFTHVGFEGSGNLQSGLEAREKWRYRKMTRSCRSQENDPWSE